jgi:hypothetical protein
MLHKTIRNNNELTEKPTMTIDDDWSAALYWDEDEESDRASLLIESIDYRFELVLHVTDKEKLKDVLQTFLSNLQELYTE